MKHSISKKIVSGMLVLSLSILPTLTVDAAEPAHKEVIVSEEFAKSQKGIQRYGEREVITVLATDYRTTTVTPSGQPSGGYRFPTGGGVYVNTSGGPTLSVGFSVSWGGVVSTGVSIGLAGTASSVGGVYLTAPTKTKYYRAKIDKKYKIERHKVDVYQTGTYQYTYYTTPATLSSISAYLQEVK